MALEAIFPAATATSRGSAVDDTSMGRVESLEARFKSASEMALIMVGLREGRLPVDSRSLSPGADDIWI